MSKKAKDTYQEGLASYRLGCAHEKNKDFDTALQVNETENQYLLYLFVYFILTVSQEFPGEVSLP